MNNNGINKDVAIDPNQAEKEPNYILQVTGYLIKIPNETEQIKQFLENDQRINQFQFIFSTFKAELTPFAKGGERLAYRALTEKGEKVVLKRFFQPRPLTMIMETIERQLICIYLSNIFNNLNISPNKLHFLPNYLFIPSNTNELHNQILSLEETEELVNKAMRTPNFVEPFINGYFVKFIDNNGWINEDEFHSTLHTFAHWTWVYTKGNILICDIQGVTANNTFLLTDPALHHKDDMKFMYSETNLGEDGIVQFFKTHQCNKLCQGLNLPKHRDQSLPNTLKGTTINPNVQRRMKEYYEKKGEQQQQQKHHKKHHHHHHEKQTNAFDFKENAMSPNHVQQPIQQNQVNPLAGSKPKMMVKKIDTNNLSNSNSSNNLNNSNDQMRPYNQPSPRSSNGNLSHQMPQYNHANLPDHRQPNLSPLKTKPAQSQSPLFNMSPQIPSIQVPPNQMNQINQQKPVQQMQQNTQSPQIPPKPNNIAQVIKQFQLAPVVGKCIVNYVFNSTNENELQLYQNDVIDLLFKTGPWWIGKRNNTIGVFPSSFAQELTDNYVGVINQNFRADRDGFLNVMRGDEVHVVGQNGNMYKVVKGYTVGYIPKNICSKK